MSRNQHALDSDETYEECWKMEEETKDEGSSDSAEFKECLAKWQQTRKETLDRLKELIDQLDKSAKEVDKAQLMGSPCSLVGTVIGMHGVVLIGSPFLCGAVPGI